MWEAGGGTGWGAAMCMSMIGLITSSQVSGHSLGHCYYLVANTGTRGVSSGEPPLIYSGVRNIMHIPANLTFILKVVGMLREEVDIVQGRVESG